VLVRAIVLAAHGQHAAVARLIGTRSAEEEVDDEIRDLRARGRRGNDR
jgi:hypothetical protein